MSKFSEHFRMYESDAIDYAIEKGLFKPVANLECEEIGDGNINFIFRVRDVDTGKSIIIKHADYSTRSGGTLSLERNRIEAEILQLEKKYAPAYVPDVYLHDPVMCCVVMQDVGDHENMRYALIAHKKFPTFVEDITTFMAETLIRTTDNILDPIDKKELQRKYINPMMCEISERVVYTGPFTDHWGANVLFEPNEAFFKKTLYEDMELHLEVAKLKEDFKSNGQALIHGDLHTGSIFVKPGSTMVLDPEFAFYGPIGYDVGNVIANLVFAWANAEVTISDPVERADYQTWLEDTITGTADRFYEKALKILREETTDRMAQTPGFSEWYMSTVMSDTAGVAGLEINRRIVGSAKVRDIAGIEDPDARKLAERICVLCAKEFILKRNDKYQVGEDYIDTIRHVAKSVSLD